MADPHQEAVEAALGTVEALRGLFAQMGMRERPQGRLMRAYRVARQALRSGVDNPRLVGQVLAELRGAIAVAIDELLDQAHDLGVQQAERELAAYGVGLSVGVNLLPIADEMRRAWLVQVDAQHARVRALALGGAGASVILGDEARLGLLSPFPIMAEGTRWLAQLTAAAHVATLEAAVARAGRQEEFGRQAIAGLDERTTNCCLKVHGQVVGLKEPFRLTGTPRFADQVMAPPFHYFCRTSTALVRLEDAGDILTRTMRAAARAELTARQQTGTRVEIHPAHATSRRS